MSRIVASGADLVFTTSWGNDLTLLIKQAKPFGLKAKFAGYYLSDEETVSAIGDSELLVGSIASETYMLTIPTEENKKFIEGYYKDTGNYPFWLRGKSYTGTMFWAEALKKAKTDDVNAVIKAWEGLSFKGVAGTWTMRCVRSPGPGAHLDRRDCPSEQIHEASLCGDPNHDSGEGDRSPL